MGFEDTRTSSGRSSRLPRLSPDHPLLLLQRIAEGRRDVARENLRAAERARQAAEDADKGPRVGPPGTLTRLLDAMQAADNVTTRIGYELFQRQSILAFSAEQADRARAALQAAEATVAEIASRVTIAVEAAFTSQLVNGGQPNAPSPLTRLTKLLVIAPAAPPAALAAKV